MKKRILSILAAGTVAAAGSVQAINLDDFQKMVSGIRTAVTDVPVAIDSIKNLVNQLQPLIQEVQSAQKVSVKISVITQAMPLITDLVAKLSVVVKNIGTNIVSVFDKATAAKIQETVGAMDTLISHIRAMNDTLQQAVSTIQTLER